MVGFSSASSTWALGTMAQAGPRGASLARRIGVVTLFASLTSSVVGCGGEVSIGKVGPQSNPEPDAGGPSTPGSDAGSAPPTPRSPSCEAYAVATTVIAAQPGEVTDFAGNGSGGIAARNLVGGGGTNELVTWPGAAGGDRLIDLTGQRLRSVGFAAGGVGTRGEQGGDTRVSVVGAASPSTVLRSTSFVPKDGVTFATHPSRADVAFAAADTVYRLVSGGAPSPEMLLSGAFSIRSLAMNATRTIALAEYMMDDRAPFHIVVRDAPNGTGVETVATLDTVQSASNVVVDEQFAYVASIDLATATVYRIPLDGANLQVTDAQAIATIPDSSGISSQLAVDDTHVYLARSEHGVCTPPAPCSAPVTIGRVLKNPTSAASNPLVPLKSFVGSAVYGSGLRHVAVDACHLLWLEGGDVKAQAKSKL